VKPIKNLAVRLDEEIPLLTVETLDNLKAWREAKELFRSTKADLVARDRKRGVSRLIAEQRAMSHPDMAEAITFTGYYRAEYHACAAALLALTNLPEELR
jgi:hypothetical protein